MKIYGLQKLTLLDYPGKVACTLFTGGCNFRCPFCQNASLVDHLEESTVMDEGKIIAYLKKRVGILDGVCVSGGEPLLQPDLELFLKELKEMDYAVKLDTNGSFPDRLKALVQKKLIDYVAMDIKNSLEHYSQTVGMENFETSKVKESVAFLLEGSVPYEFRTTVVRELHTAEDLLSIAQWIKDAPHYYLQTFEDSGDILKPGLSGYEKEEMKELLGLLRKTMKTVELRGI